MHCRLCTRKDQDFTTHLPPFLGIIGTWHFPSEFDIFGTNYLAFRIFLHTIIGTNFGTFLVIRSFFVQTMQQFQSKLLFLLKPKERKSVNLNTFLLLIVCRFLESQLVFLSLSTTEIVSTSATTTD